jgi:phenylalanyl-tRNA synthetase beta chain
MKVSRLWLTKFFDTELPNAESLAEALTFHSFEIEGIEKMGGDEVLDVKVTPNRGHDCLCHRGIAKELSAILNIPLTHDPFDNASDLSKKTDAVSVTIENPDLCKRYIAGYIKGVKVGPSPKWLRERLEAIGQRSINNVVDATNFVMFNTGQPLHAFDAGKLQQKQGTYAIAVRSAKTGEKFVGLDKKEYTLSDSMLVIADAHAHEAIGVAGVKGGLPSGITEATKDIIIESANFDGAAIRRTAQALKLRTDASTRFEQVLSPELASRGMQGMVEFIQHMVGGEVVGFVDAYPNPQKAWNVSVSLLQVQELLGTSFGKKEIQDSFSRLHFNVTEEGETFTVAVPSERLDLQIPEDLVEEVGRIIGYDKVPATPLPPFPKKPEINTNFYAAERVREELTSRGYSEVFTSVFADKGERAVLNKVDSVKPYLRSTLLDGLADALEKNKHARELLGLKDVKLFEIGAVWKEGKEVVLLGTISETEKVEVPLEARDAVSYEDLPLSAATRFQPFSRYPYIVRDIALWVSSETTPDSPLQIIRKEAGELLVRSELFDQFQKERRTSLAFRLVFQSFERTLTEVEVNALMEKITAALKENGWEVR